MQLCKVLPPIPTTGLTSADVPSLAIRVREMMVQTLSELSGAPHAPPTSALHPSSSSEPTPPPTALAPPVPVVVSTPFQSKDVVPSIATPSGPDRDHPEREHEPSSPDTRMETLSESGSSARRTDGSENGTETEEDEGMVLVGHPSPVRSG